MKPPEEDARGLVDPARGLRHFELLRFEPQTPLDRFIDRYWVARWDLEEPFDQKVLTFPSAHLIFENGGAYLSTMWKDDFVRHLEGRGQVVAVMFRSAGFQPFLGRPMSSIPEAQLQVEEVFGAAGAALAGAVAAVQGDLHRVTGLIHDFLVSRAPVDCGMSEMVSEVVELIQADPSLGRVDDLAARLETSPRQLQRLFAKYVGATPKFVIQRSRIQLAAEAALGPDPDWARLAAELGYSDQAHLTRSFTREIGRPPAAYRAQLADRPAETDSATK